MRRSSIFSFETLQLGRRSLARGCVVVLSALSFVMACEAALRLDSSPKSLPFRDTRVGTIMDVCSLSEDSQRTDRPSEGKNTEVVFLGSSQCAYNISPKDLWIAWGRQPPVNALNLGMPGCNIRTVVAFVEAFQEQLDVPIMVVVCAPPGMQGPLVTDVIDSPGRDYLQHRLPLPEQLLMESFAFRYRRQYRDLRYQYYLLRTFRAEADLDRRLGPFRCGWRPGQGNFLASTDLNQADNRNGKSDRISLSSTPEVWESLSKTFRRVVKQGTKVICLVPPQPPRFDDIVDEPAAMWDDFLHQLTTVCDQQGVLLIDHHRLDDFGDDSFFDYTHLKNEDARRYSRYLGKQFAKLEW